MNYVLLCILHLSRDVSLIPLFIYITAYFSYEAAGSLRADSV